MTALAVVANAFANLYAITTRADAETVRRVNIMMWEPSARTPFRPLKHPLQTVFERTKGCSGCDGVLGDV
jgi:hypothetical protein